MKESIRTTLANSFDDAGNFDAEALGSTMHDAGYDFDDEEIHALAAAIEYYDGDIEQARATIERGEYRHYPDVWDVDELGRELVVEEMEGQHLPQLILDYLDVEALGRDVSKDAECGKFTRFGYFAPEKW